MLLIGFKTDIFILILRAAVESIVIKSRHFLSGKIEVQSIKFIMIITMIKIIHNNFYRIHNPNTPIILIMMKSIVIQNDIERKPLHINL